jgi:phosphatidylserine/phosphatidylglycerophosphate/cardiolipin synthase-like enzyme
MPLALDTPPAPGELVRVRQRRYLVEAVAPAPSPEDQTLVRLSCLEDDAEGEELEVLWEKELDARRFDAADWTRLAQGNFDEPRHFGAYYHTLRWNAVTSIDPQLFQAPYRAGIRIDAYQLEPLRKALLLPREFADSLRRDWPGTRRPEVYYDPRSLAPVGDHRATWHAKCVLVDEEVAFVTSANFTEWAQERNVEAGVLVRDRDFTGQLRSQFDGLVQGRQVVRLPGF